MGLAAETANLIVALRLDDGLSGPLGGLSTKLRGMDRGLSQMGKGMGQLGTGLDKIATRAAIAATAGLGAVITTAASFEQAFTGVEKTVDPLTTDLAALNEELREMARSRPVSFEELAGIAEAAGALGVAGDDIGEFVDVVSRLSVSTDLSAEAASTALGQLGNVLHLTGDEYEDFADSLVALGNAGASTESQIVEIAARFGAAGNSAGLTKEEILALSSAVASMGIEVEAGGSSLSRIFSNVATAIGTGSDDVEAFTELLGISADEFQTRWGEDALGTFQDFLGELNKLDQFGQARVLEEAGITGVRDQNAVRLMAQNVGMVNDQLAISVGQTDELTQESDKFFATAQSQWKTLGNIVRDGAAIIGEEVLPVTKEIMTEISEALNNPETREGLKQFGQDLAGGIRSLVDEIKRVDFGPIISVMTSAADAAKGAFNVFRSLPPEVQSLALAAYGINKVTGGAVGDIAKGFGNILGGGLKLLTMRGVSPAAPMFVKEVGLIGGAGGGALGAGGKGGGLGGALKFLGPLGLAAAASEFSDEIVGAGVDLHDEWGIADPPKWLTDFLDWSPFKPQPVAGAVARSRGGSFADDIVVKGAEGSDTALLREFGGKLDKLATEDVIEHLERTTETGLKDVGNSFQVGIKTGLDPVGDVATRILARAEDPKAPPVMAEIKGHLSGLEEIQAQYLATGDITLANKVQTNIDTLHQLIGTTDSVRGVTAALADHARSSDAAMLATAGRAVAETQALNQSEGTRAAATQARIDAAKAAVHTLNASEGTRAASQHAALTTVRETARSGLAGVSGRVDVMKAALSGQLGTLIAKKWQINTTNVFSPNISVNAGQIYRETSRWETSTNSGGI